jgi:uncharacterized protein
MRWLAAACACALLAACSGQGGEAADGMHASASALEQAQAQADAGRAARAKAQADGIVAARAFAAAHGAPKAATSPAAALLGAPDAHGFADLDWSKMMPPGDVKLLAEAPPVVHVGNQRMKQVGTLHAVAALDGRKVRLSGYVVPLESDDDGRMVEFFFVPFYGACIHVPPPPPNMMVHVKLARGIDTPSLYDPLTLSGTLHIETTQNPMAASAYGMADATLGAYQDNDAQRLRNAFE